MDLNSILIIVGSIVLLGVAGAAAFAILKVRGLIASLDTTVGQKLDEVKATTEGLKPAVAQLDDIMGKVNLTLDSLDIELVNIDGKLTQLAGITGQVAGVTEAVPEIASQAKTTIRNTLFNR